MKSIYSHILLVAILLCLPFTLHAEEIIINAVGDIMLAGRWAPVLKKRGYDHPFDGVRAHLAGADINLGNLEAPIARGGDEFREKKFRFRAEPAVATALQRAGFNLVTLANNHSMDFGASALEETLLHLKNAGIAWVGAGNNLGEARQMKLFTIKGTRIAFLGYSLTQPIEFFVGKERPGTAPGYARMVASDVAAARTQADFVIVSFHWGKEANPLVQPYQQTAAHNAVDAGADAVIGHHPHILQGIERYKRAIIFYSLGNFTFAAKSTTADVSAIIRLRLNGEQRSAEVLPLDVLYRRVGFQPQLLKGVRGAEVIDKLNILSETFNTRIQSKEGRYTIPF
ncbi:MAG TPA: CapA family protein [Desulfuromonadales bacterium]|nr:CapA family protein [Desulfuromonadales bacterium]